MRRVCVFCGSRAGHRPAYAAAAAALGEAIARRGLGLVYGGASVGLMGTVADAALAAGGEVIGVLPEGLARREIAHAGLAELHVVDSMHARKTMMADASDAFVALPGGLGTLEEVFEVWTWSQLGIHAKPVGFLDVEGYFAGLFDFLDRSVAEGFVTAPHRALALRAEEPDRLLDRLAAADLSAMTPDGLGREAR
jgi:uncharacterized protein (TIGR00730 family)